VGPVAADQLLPGHHHYERASDARAAIGRVRAIHQKITGTAPDGRPYAASDPHLLTWVHIAEADSFLRWRQPAPGLAGSSALASAGIVTYHHDPRDDPGQLTNRAAVVASGTRLR
jgi:hypothetical protein